MSSNSNVYSLRSSGSLSNILQIPKNGLQRKVTSKLYLAKKKLLPVIHDVMKTAKENGSRKPYPLNKSYYLTVDQYKDAVWASHLLKEVDEMFRYNKSRKHLSKFKTHHFNLEHTKVKVNRCGKIYVDTSILVQLIELHNMFGEIIDYIQGLPSEGQTEGQTETEESSNGTRPDEDRSKFNDILADLEDQSSNGTEKNQPQTKLTKEILTSLTLPLDNNFIVMTAQSSEPAGSRNNLTTLAEETTSNSEVNLTEDSQKAARKTKSTSSLMDDEKSQVTDAAGARRIIVRCMSDLDKVRHYLERDYVTGISSVDRGLDAEARDDKRREEQRREEDMLDEDGGEEGAEEQEPDHTIDLRDDQKDGREHVEKPERRRRSSGQERPHASSDDQKKCCCADDCPADQPLEFTWQEEGETNSKLVICIKGKSEEDGDVHIVIKQCPECKLYGQDVGVSKDEISKDPKRDASKHERPKSERSKDKHANFESAILHGKDPEDDCVVSSAEDMNESQNNINVIFDPTDPSRSIVEGVRKKSSRKKRPSHVQEVPSGKTSTIKLNETINLNLQTDQGQDLIISLTVRPKADKAIPILSINDIFSESQTNIPEKDKTEHPERDVTKQETPEEEEEEEEDDLGIPLSRTKVCSSLEFDVQMVNSRMKSTGIRHKNANISFRLNDLGVNNLLRASRPVKCGRKAILNETLMKCLPYSPSLKSLPLEDMDTEIIDQSLNMSITKSKHSTIYIKDAKMSYTVEVSNNKKPAMKENRTKQVYFVHVPLPKVLLNGKPIKKRAWVEDFLSFYINLENDIRAQTMRHFYEIRYFEIDNIRKDNKTNPPETVFSVRLKNNGRPNQVVSDKSKVKGFENLTSVKNKEDFGRPQARKLPSKIPIYKYRKSVAKKVTGFGVPDLYEVSLMSLPRKEKETKGFAVEFKNLIVPNKQTNNNFVKPSSNHEAPVKQVKNKSLMTLKNVSKTNTVEIFPPNNFTSADSLEYFNCFLRNAAFLQSSASSRERKKRKEFYSSRSQSLIVLRSSAEREHLGDAVGALNDNPKKCIKHNNVVLSSTKFKKQLNCEKTMSRILVNDLSAFVYEHFIRDLSAEAKFEILRRIDNVLGLYTKMKMRQKLGNESGKEKAR